MLREAGIQVILDHHALPGVQAVNQMFTGKCVIFLATITHAGNLMPHLKLYLNSPVLRGYSRDIFYFCCLS
jgi:hypothetical protein